MSKALFLKGTNDIVGHLTDDEFAFLQRHLVKERADDMDYWIDASVLEFLGEKGMSAGIRALLERALEMAGGGADGVEVEWCE